MNKTINITQAEKLTGVSKRNIRFYEKEGLLTPERNAENSYREYTQEDIRKLKIIKMLRMLDMPIDEVKEVLNQGQTLEQAVSNQKKRLEQKEQEVKAAISFCDRLEGADIQTVDIDACLKKMEQEEVTGLFTSWVHDYKKIKEQNKDRDFTFTPDGAICNAREFTDALFAYAAQEHLNLTITKESMYPEFMINGVEYTAERYYNYEVGIPVAHVHCYAKNRDVKADQISKRRKGILWFLYKWWLILLTIIVDVALFYRFFLPSNPSLIDWAIPATVVILQTTGLFRYYIFYDNNKHH